MNDLVSIIMPSYNTGKFIAETIKSVQTQTYKNWELIIIDDDSTDNTDEVVEPFLKEDKRITYRKNKRNSGAAISRNRALRLAKGRWVAFLDSDDLWHSEKLKRQIAFMERTECHFSYTAYSEMDEMSRNTGIIVKGPKKVSKRMMYAYCWPGCLTVMYDRKFVGDIQIVDIRKNNDYAMWLKISKKAECYFLNQVLAKYRKRSGSISNHGYRELLLWHYRLFREAENENVIISTLLTIQNLLFGSLKKILYVKKADL